MIFSETESRLGHLLGIVADYVAETRVALDKMIHLS